jgi:glycine cleavage system H protein
LGDVVYLDLPDPDTKVQQTQTFGSVESVKAASDLYAPVSGTVIEKNNAVTGKPQLVNESAMGAGWLIKVKLSDKNELKSLLDAVAYDKHCAEEQ